MLPIIKIVHPGLPGLWIKTEKKIGIYYKFTNEANADISS